MSKIDLVIIGGGPAGMAAAVAAFMCTLGEERCTYTRKKIYYT